MSKKRLLVIEDDLDVAEMLIHYFTSQGFEVINALNGGDGIAMARSKFPNLILLDVMLPDMDGFDVCKVLRNTTLTKYIPITFLTQRDARADKVAGLELGADDYVTKPFDVEELRLRIQGSLRRSTREQLHDPRTGLPTSALVTEMRDAVMALPGLKQLNLQLLGLDAFRDKYGFVAADEALAFVGQTLSEAITKNGTPNDVAGVLGEDKYLIYTFCPDLNVFTDSLVKSFAEGAKKLYNFADSEQGYLVIPALENGADQHIPLMYLVATQAEVQTQTQQI